MFTFLKGGWDRVIAWFAGKVARKELGIDGAGWRAVIETVHELERSENLTGAQKKEIARATVLKQATKTTEAFLTNVVIELAILVIRKRVLKEFQ